MIYKDSSDAITKSSSPATGRMVHDAILDTNKKHTGNPNAGSLSEAYNVSLWVGTLSARQKFLSGKPTKTTKK